MSQQRETIRIARLDGSHCTWCPDDCRWFGVRGPIPDAKLRECGCERCQQELVQHAFLHSLLAGR